MSEKGLSSYGHERWGVGGSLLPSKARASLAKSFSTYRALRLPKVHARHPGPNVAMSESTFSSGCSKRNFFILEGCPASGQSFVQYKQ